MVIKHLFTVLILLAVVPAIRSLQADTVFLKDGTKVEGDIVDENDDQVVVKVKFGEAKYPKTEVKDILRTKKAGTEALAPADLRDRFVMKSGEKHSGLLVSESNTEYVVDLIDDNVNSSKRHILQTQVPKNEVDSVKLLMPEQRKVARQYLEKLDVQNQADKLNEKSIEATKLTWPTETGTKPAFRIELEFFDLESDNSEEFTKRCAFQLAKVYAAYKQAFTVDKSIASRIKVMIFNSMEEYYANIKNSMKNPAFYSPDKNLICAGCDVEVYERQNKEIKAKIDEINVKIEEWRKKANDARGELSKAVRAAQDKIFERGMTTPEGRAIADEIARYQRNVQLDIAEKEHKVLEFQEALAEFNRQRNRLFKEVTQQMMRTLYHESFHAFLNNYLFEGQSRRVPRWLNEGMAMYFELARIEDGRLILGQSDREYMALLRNFKHEGKLLKMDQLVKGDQAEFLSHDLASVEISNLHYLESWLLASWMGSHGRINGELLKKYVEAIPAGSAKHEALPVLTGIDNTRLEAELDAMLTSTKAGP